MYLHVDLTDTELDYLKRCARIRQTSVFQLTQRLFRTIAKDELVLAILDDDSRPVDAKRYHYRPIPQAKAPTRQVS